MVFVYIYAIYISFDHLGIFFFLEGLILDNTSKLWKSIEVKYFFIYKKKNTN